MAQVKSGCRLAASLQPPWTRGSRQSGLVWGLVVDKHVSGADAHLQHNCTRVASHHGGVHGLALGPSSQSRDLVVVYNLCFCFHLFGDWLAVMGASLGLGPGCARQDAATMAWLSKTEVWVRSLV